MAEAEEVSIPLKQYKTMDTKDFKLEEKFGTDSEEEVLITASETLEVSEAEQINYLEGRETNFVFIFGRSGAGKTAITASLINYLSTECEHGNLVGIDNGDGRRLLETIRNTIRDKRFPDQTRIGSLTHIDIRFEPLKKSKSNLWITFLEMSGENLTAIELRDNTPSQFPPNIDVFFKANNLSMIFVLVTSQQQANRDDALMVTFLDYIIGKDSRFQNSRLLLLVSQWDTFVGEIETEEFIRTRMPLTYARLRKNTNAIRNFSLGRITMVDNFPRIQEYNGEPAEKVFHWIYETLTGKSLVSWWEKFRRYF